MILLPFTFFWGFVFSGFFFLLCFLFSFIISGKTGVKVKVKVAQLCLTLCNPMDYKVQGIFQARMPECIAVPFSRDLPNPGIKPRSPTLQVEFSPAEPQGKSKNTGVGSLSLLQQIFPTQESNQGLVVLNSLNFCLSIKLLISPS